MPQIYELKKALIDRYRLGGTEKHFAVQILARDTWLSYSEAEKLIGKCAKDGQFEKLVLQGPMNFAELFDDQNAEFLANFGFKLTSDPSLVQGRYGYCLARYTNERGIWVSTSWDADSSIINLKIGLNSGKAKAYADIANLLGIDLSLIHI